jgi:hypothetical protein
MLRGRGYCTLAPANPAGPVQIRISAGTSAAEAFDGAQFAWPNQAFIRVPVVSDTHQLGWSSERTLNVLAGGVYTVGLFARAYETQAINSQSCAGSFTVEIYTGTLE